MRPTLLTFAIPLARSLLISRFASSCNAAIIAEIFRLSEFVPEEFRLATKEHQRNYGEILLDFSYFKMSELANQRIENNPVRALSPRRPGSERGYSSADRVCAPRPTQDLLDRDDAFQESHINIVTRFYLLFESIFKYVKDLVRYLTDLDEGTFIQQSLEVKPVVLFVLIVHACQGRPDPALTRSPVPLFRHQIVIATPEGKQLLAEALYLYGTMLLTLDRKIEGVLRERMLVAYHRYKVRAPPTAPLPPLPLPPPNPPPTPAHLTPNPPPRTTLPVPCNSPTDGGTQ